MISNIICIGAGGALGTLFRYLLNFNSLYMNNPIATLLANLMGSFLLGVLTGLTIYWAMKECLRLGAGVGFCGGFTTMSTFAADTFVLNNQDLFLQVFAYISLTLFAGVFFSYLGFIVGISLGRLAARKKVRNIS